MRLVLTGLAPPAPYQIRDGLRTMELNGKILAIILWGECDGEEEASCHTGTLRKSGARYEFYRGEGSPAFNLEPQWLERIKPVPDDLKETLLDADISLITYSRTNSRRYGRI